MVEDDEGPRPQGFLVAVGGNEDKESDLKVLRAIADLPAGGTRTVEVIPTASSIPDKVAKQYVSAFGKIGVSDVRIMDIRSREDAKNEEFVQRIRDCDVVFLTGGDQLRLTSLLGGSPVGNAIKGHYWRGGVVAGTSAGAAAMSDTMIFEGAAEKSLTKGNVYMTPGLGLVRKVVVDTHFIHRGRLSRLLEVVTSNPGHVGVGLSEDTAVIMPHGDSLEVEGSGLVIVVDGRNLGYTNISQIKLGEPIAVERMVVHTLAAGCGYDLREHRYIPPKPKEQSVKDERKREEAKHADS